MGKVKTFADKQKDTETNGQKLISVPESPTWRTTHLIHKMNDVRLRMT